jgi:transposase
MSKRTAAPAAERGASEQAIGVTKGGRNSKLHALVDKLCRPWVIILTPGNVADCTVGPECVSLIAGIKKLLGDKAYDNNPFRKSLRQDGITPVIPGRANRKKRIRHDKQAYKGRNVIERCYCRLKDFRRIATRYDKLARNFFSGVCLVAALVYWM